MACCAESLIATPAGAWHVRTRRPRPDRPPLPARSGAGPEGLGADHAVRLEGCVLPGVEAEDLLVDAVVVLAEERRRRARTERARRQPPRGGDEAVRLADLRRHQLFPEAARLEVWVAEQLAPRQHRARRHAPALEPVHELEVVEAARPRGQPLVDPIVVGA